MANPDWYDVLANSLKEYLESPSNRSVDGEQFFRAYLVDNPLESYSEEDEDQIVDEHLDNFQDYLLKFDWLKVDKTSYRWISKPTEKEKETTENKNHGGNHICDINRLEKIFAKESNLDVADIEWAKQELLIENCDFNNAEALAYRLAKEINHHSNFTLEDRYDAWIFAANKSRSSIKYVECMELAADCKASLFKFDEAAMALNKAIYKLDSSLKISEESRWIKSIADHAKRRVTLSFSAGTGDHDELLLRLIRKCRVYYEQAGNREMSSQLFVIETDVVYRSKNSSVKFFMLLYWMFSKYGESPLRVLVTSLVIILSWATMYQCMGIHYNLSSGKDALELFETNVYFSVVTFTTLGYGDFSPPDNGRLLASFQAMLGLFMTSLFLVTFVRRYSR